MACPSALCVFVFELPNCRWGIHARVWSDNGTTSVCFYGAGCSCTRPAHAWSSYRPVAAYFQNLKFNKRVGLILGQPEWLLDPTYIYCVLLSVITSNWITNNMYTYSNWCNLYAVSHTLPSTIQAPRTFSKKRLYSGIHTKTIHAHKTQCCGCDENGKYCALSGNRTHISRAFQTSALALHHIGFLMSLLYLCLLIYAAPCLKYQCKLLQSLQYFWFTCRTKFR